MAPVEVPIGNVAAGVAKDMVVEERRTKVHPPLINEVAVRRVVKAVAPEMLLPPVENRPRCRPQRHESKVEDPGVQDVNLARVPVVARHRLEHVGCEHHPVLPCQGAEIVERSEHFDVRVEVDDGCSPVVECMTQQPRFHGGGQLEQLVDRGHAAEFRTVQPDVVRAEHLERLVCEIGVLVSVENKHRQVALGVVPKERFRQNAGMGEVIARHDRAHMQSTRRIRVWRHGTTP